VDVADLRSERRFQIRHAAAAPAEISADDETEVAPLDEQRDGEIVGIRDARDNRSVEKLSADGDAFRGRALPEIEDLADGDRVASAGSRDGGVLVVRERGGRERLAV